MSTYADLFERLAAELEARPGQRLELWWSEVESFACSRCGQSCRRPWQIKVSRDYVRQWAGPLSQITGLPPEALFLPVHDSRDRQAWARLAKKPGSEECVLFDGQGCSMHMRFGADSKPAVCQSYPFSDAFTDLRTRRPDYKSPALALSCTRAAEMLLEPQQLSWRFVPAGLVAPRTAVVLSPGRELSRLDWLQWLGHAFDALEAPATADFGPWLAASTAALRALLAEAGPQSWQPTPQTPAPDALPALNAWLDQQVLTPRPALHPLRTDEQDSGIKSALLEDFTRAWLRRQLLQPVPLLRGELDLLQHHLALATQAHLLRRRARALAGSEGSLGPDQLVAAANLIGYHLTREHAPGLWQSWRSLDTAQCLDWLEALAAAES